jgi:hypothetical protein
MWQIIPAWLLAERWVEDVFLSASPGLAIPSNSPEVIKSEVFIKIIYFLLLSAVTPSVMIRGNRCIGTFWPHALSLFITADGRRNCVYHRGYGGLNDRQHTIIVYPAT